MWPLPDHRAGRLSMSDGAELPYLRMGDGPVPLVTVLGAGDGQRTVSDAATQLAWLFRGRRDRYRMLLLSRRHPIPDDHGIAGHAADMVWAVEQLGWGRAVWECNSAGGPIGQLVAHRRPDLVAGLVLSSSLHRTAAHTRSVLERWLELLDRRRWRDYLWSTIEHTYHHGLWRYRLAKPLLGLTIRRDYIDTRTRPILRELLDLDHRRILPSIAAPALVVGGERDRVVPPEIMREMADLLPDSRLRLYDAYGHGNDVENPAYAHDLDEFVAVANAGASSP
jgi:pimeloyl-ACP methyl ester carboxylesterase